MCGLNHIQLLKRSIAWCLLIAVILIGFIYGDPKGNVAQKACAYLGYTFTGIFIIVIYAMCYEWFWCTNDYMILSASEQTRPTLIVWRTYVSSFSPHVVTSEPGHTEDNL